jgi:Zn-dependent M28 family amino/carboxypeptidase
LFAEVGIPVGGLFSGADAIKTESEAERFGGRAGSAHDPCYHLACDDLGNIDRTILSQMAEAVAGVVGRLLSGQS